ncbi:MAG: PotD/PotF family extracellular solute-binding protein [Haloferacaceae archaeon]
MAYHTTEGGDESSSGNSRRTFLKTAGAAGAAGIAGLSGCTGAIGGGGGPVEITMMAWDDYALFKEGIEEKLDVKLNVTKSNSSAKMFSAWNSGQNAQYDITVPNNNYVGKFIDAGLVAPMPKDVVTNYSSLFPKFHEFAKNQFTDSSGKLYSTPIRFGWYGYSYDNRTVPDDHDQTYAQLWNDEWKGKIIMYDNHFKAMSATALLLGYQDAFSGEKVTLSESQIQKVKNKMIEQKPLLQGYIGPDSTYIKSFRQGNHVIGQSGRNEIMDLQKAGDTWAQMAKPKEGELAWFEGTVVSSKSDNKEMAWKVVNQYIDPEFGTTFARKASTPSCNPKANAKLSGQNAKLFGFGPERLSGMIPFKAVENEDAWISAWEEIKAA